MCIGLHVKYPLFFSNFNETWVFLMDFRNFRIKYHKNSFNEGRVVPCGRTDGRTTGTKNLIVAFRSFANAPKTGSAYYTFTWLKANFTFLTTSFSSIFMTHNRYIATITRRPLESVNRDSTEFVLTSPSVCCHKFSRQRLALSRGLYFGL